MRSGQDRKKTVSAKKIDDVTDRALHWSHESRKSREMRTPASAAYKYQKIFKILLGAENALLDHGERLNE
jgi:hypothetical protein